MKSILYLPAFTFSALLVNTCDMAGNTDNECGADFDLESAIYYKEDARDIDTAYLGKSLHQVQQLR